MLRVTRGPAVDPFPPMAIVMVVMGPKRALGHPSACSRRNFRGMLRVTRADADAGDPGAMLLVPMSQHMAQPCCQHGPTTAVVMMVMAAPGP